MLVFSTESGWPIDKKTTTQDYSLSSPLILWTINYDQRSTQIETINKLPCPGDQNRTNLNDGRKGSNKHPVASCPYWAPRPVETIESRVSPKLG